MDRYTLVISEQAQRALAEILKKHQEFEPAWRAVCLLLERVPHTRTIRGQSYGMVPLDRHPVFNYPAYTIYFRIRGAAVEVTAIEESPPEEEEG